MPFFSQSTPKQFGDPKVKIKKKLIFVKENLKSEPNVKWVGTLDNYDGPVSLSFLIKMCSTKQTKFDVKRAT